MIENLLRSSDENASNQRLLDHERHTSNTHHENNTKMNDFHSKSLSREYQERHAASASIRHGNILYREKERYSKVCCNLLGCFCEDGNQRCDRIFYSQPLHCRIRHMPIIRGNDCHCQGACASYKNSGIVECRFPEAMIYHKRYFTDLINQEKRLNEVENTIICKPIPLRCESQSIEDRNGPAKEQKRQEDNINIKYDWMVNPRPFYRKGE